MCFISIWCYNNLFKQKNLLAIIVFVSMAGFMLNWLKMDTFRIYGFWICLALIFVSSTKKISDV